ncbi:hypothetical protein BIY24_09930 [Halobacteriovorax marinus]|uniref:YbbR-like protein n=1 Tax=Halobacteriovorax marinus (strain ATCC BAA-682 / DSM 15412 / SJ) TaxID=862908 RepID=E1X3K3_HALMS|nr:CdaR family protein [Halobacteriovorax marinus]ATH08258.1 hypothetical protein BIY24_09930 [Halobacteriovorax marinus]CBW26932.1 conserved hypothetical protein [Halobacteriovorax marinus SJ]
MKGWQKVLKKNHEYSRHLLKVVSALFAVVIWFYVLNSEPQEVTHNMTLHLVSPKGLSVSNLTPEKLSVKIKGSRAFIRTMVEREESVYLKLQNYPYQKKGGFNIFLSPEDIPVPFGIQVIDVKPDKFKVELQKEIRKNVPVKVNLVGALPSDLKLMETKIEPSEVLISGPIEVMRKISRVTTAPIDLTTLEGSGELKISLSDIDPRIESKRVTPLDFAYVVKPRKANLTLKKVKIRFLSSSNRISSKTRFVSLDVLAPEGVRLTASSVQVIADVPDERGVHSVKLRAKLPEGIHLLQINPQSINVSNR